MRDRSFRREQLEKRKKRAKRVFFHPDLPEVWYWKRANNMQKCSCYMCGNPRKWFKEKTIQEVRFSQTAPMVWRSARFLDMEEV